MRQTAHPGSSASDPRLFLTAREVATLYGVSANRVYVLAAEGLIPGVRTGRTWRFPRAGIDEVIRRAAQNAAVETAARDDTLAHLERRIEEAATRAVVAALQAQLPAVTAAFQTAARQGTVHALADAFGAARAASTATRSGADGTADTAAAA